MTKSMSIKGSGTRLKELRQKLGLSPGEMARHLGLSQNAYYKNENSETFPGAATIILLEKDYDVSMDWLMFGKGPVFYNKEKQRVEAMEKELETLKKEHEKTLAKTKEIEDKLSVDNKPGLKELFEYMERVPVFYHELMVYFQNYKMTAEPGRKTAAKKKG